MQLDGFLVVLDAGVLLRAVRCPAQQRAHLVDDLGVVGTGGDVRFGVVGGELQRGGEAVLHLAAVALRQGFGDGDTLAVTAHGVGAGVVGVGVLRVGGDGGFGPIHDFVVELEPGRLVVFQIIGVDVGRLVGGVDAFTAGFQANLDGTLEVTGVIAPPSFLRGLICGEGFLVAQVQAVPVLL